MFLSVLPQRLRAWLGRAPATDQAQSGQPRGLAARTASKPLHTRHRVLSVLHFAAIRAREEHLTQAAAGLSFTTLLSVVPLLAVIFALFTAFPLFNQFRIALDDFMVNNLMPAAVADGVMNYINRFALEASRLTTLGGIVLLATSISLIVTIDKVFNAIWHVTRQRSLLQRLLVYWTVMSVGPVMLGASLWTMSYITRQSMGLMGDVSFAANLILALIPILVTGLGLSALFVVVPNRYVRWTDALAGGFLAAVVLELLKAWLAWYLARFTAYTVVYGTFAALPILMVWMYISWLVVLFSATISASIPLIRFGRREIYRRPGSPFVDALEILGTLAQRRGAVPPGLSTRYLRAHLHAHNDELMNVLDVLESLGYVACLGEGRKERWALVCDPATATLGPVLDKLLIDRQQPLLAENPELRARFEYIWRELAHGRQPTVAELCHSHTCELELDSAAPPSSSASS